MRRQFVASGLAAACVVAYLRSLGAAAQVEPAALQQRLADSRALTLAEIDHVLDVVRQRSGGQPFHFTADRGGFAADIVVERDGHVRFIRTMAGNAVSFSDYTGRIARNCDGSVAAGEFVMEYRQAGQEWMVTARPSSPADLLRPIFDMLVGIKPLVDSGLTADGGRGLSAVWNEGLSAPSRIGAGGGGAAGASMFVLADPTVNGVETLVIDRSTLLPARWEFSYRPAGSATADRVTASYRFVYDGTLVLSPPTGLTLPTCVDPSLPFFRR